MCGVIHDMAEGLWTQQCVGYGPQQSEVSIHGLNGYSFLPRFRHVGCVLTQQRHDSYVSERENFSFNNVDAFARADGQVHCAFTSQNIKDDLSWYTVVMLAQDLVIAEANNCGLGLCPAPFGSSFVRGSCVTGDMCAFTRVCKFWFTNGCPTGKADGTYSWWSNDWQNYSYDNSGSWRNKNSNKKQKQWVCNRCDTRNPPSWWECKICDAKWDGQHP